MPRLPSDAPAVRCVARLAADAGVRMHETILPAQPRDASFGWKASSVHPLQPLETEYQRIVRDASEDEKDDELRRRIESDKLGQFFFFDAGSPRLLGVPQGEPYGGRAFPLPGDDLTDLKRHARSAQRELERPQVRDMQRALVVSHLEAAVDRAAALLARFYTLDGSRERRISPVAEAHEALRRVRLILERATTVHDFSALATRLLEIGAALEQALAGVASVQMFYAIQPFCLFRLLVRFRLESDLKISTGTAADTSGALTSLLTEGHRWLTNWLRDKVVDLGHRVQAADPHGNTLFFLKGGRALEYYRGSPELGTSDWDTQIVINPNLPPAKWYRQFVLVNNAVLIALEQFKIEFFMLLSHHAKEFIDELPRLQEPRLLELADNGIVLDPPEPGVGNEDDAPDALHRASCKAELIDVGLPRYDSVEAREQWSLFSGGHCSIRIADDRIPYPDAIYFVDEYVMMIREVFAIGGAGLRKAPKRIVRLTEMLGRPRVRAAIDGLCGDTVTTLFPETKSRAGEIYVGDDGVPAKAALWLILHQFASAYNLSVDRELAPCLDRFLRATLTDAPGLAPYPPMLPTYIKEQRGFDSACRNLADLIGFTQWASEQMEEHFSERDAFMLYRINRFISLVRSISDLFPAEEEWNLQIATRGSFAAWLHADYLSFNGIDELDAVTFVSIGLYSPEPGASRERMLKVVEDRVQECLEGSSLRLDLERDEKNHALRLYWQKERQWTPLNSYRPLAMEIVALEPPRRPHLSYVWRVPVLSPHDLLVDARDSIADTAEYGRRRRLKQARAALIDMMTGSEEHPAPPIDGPIPGRGGRYLRVRSDSLGVGAGGDYPPSFYPDYAFELTLTADRDSFRERLLAWPLPEDGVLDLLVVGGGEGSLDGFAGWLENDLRTYLVQPLVERGVRIRAIVLDFALSAALLPVFQPLCADEGIIICSLYAPRNSIMTTATWAELQPLLAGRDVPGMVTRLVGRLKALSTDLTGFSHLAACRAMSEPEVRLHLNRNPADQDSISIVRYLPLIETMVRGAPDALGEVRRRLIDNPNVGNGEAEIISLVPRIGRLTDEVSRNVEMKFRIRLNEILSQPRYEICVATSGRPLLEGEDNLWSTLEGKWSHILALAPYLSRCPSPFSIWNESSAELTLDATLARRPIAGKPQVRISEVAASGAEDAQRIVRLILDRCRNSVLVRVPNYLQR
jgi:hypothetical protein